MREDVAAAGAAIVANRRQFQRIIDRSGEDQHQAVLQLVL